MKVLVGPNIMGLEDALPDLRNEFADVEFVYCDDRTALADAIADADVFMGGLGRELFLAGKNLKWIQSSSSGTNYFMDIQEVVDSDVLVTSASGTHAACLSESVMAMILAFTRGILSCAECQPQKTWNNREIRCDLVELTGSTMGIIGFGATGRALAKRAQAFDMRIIAVDLYPNNKPDYVSELWGLDRLHDLLKESDYTVVMTPYTPQTHGMIGAEQIAMMKPGAMLVGISRGRIIDQKALAQALREKHLVAAALDVFDPEPLPADSELWDLDNLLIMPHVAGGTQLEAKYVIDIFRENLGRFLKGDLPLRNQVDKRLGF